MPMVQVIRHGSLWRLPHPVFIHPVLTTGSLWSGTNIWPIGCLKSLQKVTLGEHRGVEISAFYCFCMAAVQGGTLGAFNWLHDVGSLFSSEALAGLWEPHHSGPTGLGEPNQHVILNRAGRLNIFLEFL